MGNDISLVMAGIGGYGNVYMGDLVKPENRKGVRIAGVVDPRPENSRYLEQIKEMEIPVFNSLEDFYDKSEADLAVISSPIQFHCEQACLALSHGSNVLCEKPVAATIQEVGSMIEARDRAEKFVAIGYQWSHNPVIQSLKDDIIKGLLGRPRRFKTIVLWPRDHKYFNRSSWAGKLRDAKGNWILDSVANNAAAHFLHNMFYVLGSQTDRSIRPAQVTAELCRANPIENFDTAAIRAETKEGIEIIFYATHAVNVRFKPQFRYKFENADVVFADPDIPESRDDIVALFHDGRVKTYGNPDDNVTRKLWMAIDAVRGNSNIVCGLEAASSHTICINAAQESMPEIVNFPQELVKVDKEQEVTWIEGLEELLKASFAKGMLPSESGASWARSGRKMNVEAYDFFRGDGIR